VGIPNNNGSLIVETFAEKLVLVDMISNDNLICSNKLYETFKYTKKL